jgi:hypothetical protein
MYQEFKRDLNTFNYRRQMVFVNPLKQKIMFFTNDTFHSTMEENRCSLMLILRFDFFSRQENLHESDGQAYDTGGQREI